MKSLSVDKGNYQNVEESTGLLTHSTIEPQSQGFFGCLKNWSIWFIGTIVVFSLMVYTKHNHTASVPHSDAPAAFIECSKTCDLAACQSNTCGLDVPYLCTTGESLYGCALNWAPLGCSECCDSSTCVEVMKAAVKPCKECSASQCAELYKSSDQRCGAENPYVCLEGSARLGCSEDSKAWKSMTSTTCRYYHRYMYIHAILICVSIIYLEIVF
jgi:hypothetical protein